MSSAEGGPNTGPKETGLEEEQEDFDRNAGPDELAVRGLMEGPHSAEGQIEREAAGYDIKYRDKGADAPGTSTAPSQPDRSKDSGPAETGDGAANPGDSPATTDDDDCAPDPSKSD
jgi:hypothetical protein